MLFYVVVVTDVVVVEKTFFVSIAWQQNVLFCHSLPKKRKRITSKIMSSLSIKQKIYLPLSWTSARKIPFISVCTYSLSLAHLLDLKHTHTHTHTHTQTNKHTQTNTNTHVDTNTYIHTPLIHIHTSSKTYTHIQTQTYKNMHTYTSTNIHTNVINYST
jgi:hypothetical protein